MLLLLKGDQGRTEALFCYTPLLFSETLYLFCSHFSCTLSSVCSALSILNVNCRSMERSVKGIEIWDNKAADLK